MSRIKSLSRRAWLLIACAVSVIAAPVISWALQRDPELQKRYDHIAKMTESERTRLEYQYEEFRSLSEAEREQYRQLHAQLTGERSDLQPTLDAYTAFLRTLNPVDRADVERCETVQDQLATVGRLVTERQSQQAQLLEGLASVERFRTERFSKGPGDERNHLDAEDLIAIGQVLESRLSPANLADLKLTPQTDPVLRATRIMEATLELHASSNRIPGRARTFDEGIAKDLAAAISSDEKREDVLKFARRDNPIDQVRSIFLAANFVGYRRMMESAPSIPEMQEILVVLPPQDRERILKSHPFQMHRELLEFHFTKQGNQQWSATSKVFRLIDQVFPRRGPGNNRPGERSGDRPGDGPPGERNDGERRGPGSNLRERIEDRLRPGEGSPPDKSPDGEPRPDGPGRF